MDQAYLFNKASYMSYNLLGSDRRVYRRGRLFFAVGLRQTGDVVGSFNQWIKRPIRWRWLARPVSGKALWPAPPSGIATNMPLPDRII